MAAFTEEERTKAAMNGDDSSPVCCSCDDDSFHGVKQQLDDPETLQEKVCRFLQGFASDDDLLCAIETDVSYAMTQSLSWVRQTLGFES